MRRIEPSVGDHIDKVAELAAFVASEYGEPIGLNFNGIEMIAQPDETAASVARRWKAAIDASVEAYRRTQEYRQAIIDREAEVSTKQRRINELLSETATVVNDIDALLPWLAEWITLGDDIGVDPCRAGVRAALRQAGWKPNVRIGDPLVHTDKQANAEWLIGQVLDAPESDQPIHPRLADMAERCAEMENQS